MSRPVLAVAFGLVAALAALLALLAGNVAPPGSFFASSNRALA
jgi:hypothetical protein